MRLTLFFLLCAAFRGAWAEPIPPHLGEWSFTDSFSYYRSAGNYVNAGMSSTNLPNGGYFQTMQDTATATWDTFKNARFDASVGFGMSAASNTASTYTGQGFTELSGGGQYWYRESKWALVPGFHAGFPFYRVNQTGTEDTLISTPAMWGEIGSWGIYYFKPFAAYAYLGFRYQDIGLAGLMPFDFGGSYRLPSGRIRAGLRGEVTVINDSNSSSPGERNVVLDRVDNNSLKFYSVNPTVVEAYGEYDYLFLRQFEGGIGFAQSFYGVNAAQGWTITAMIRFRLPSDWDYEQRPAKSEPKFRESTDSYDEGLFEESNPDETNPKPKPKKNIDKMLRDTEKQLEH